MSLILRSSTLRLVSWPIETGISWMSLHRRSNIWSDTSSPMFCRGETTFLEKETAFESVCSFFCTSGKSLSALFGTASVVSWESEHMLWGNAVKANVWMSAHKTITRKSTLHKPTHTRVHCCRARASSGFAKQISHLGERSLHSYPAWAPLDFEVHRFEEENPCWKHA